ncbi:YccF domain-containing protein [Marinomonas sp. 2405UD68-3]|uniref:YccF domain-containing protein n=1 Tax=Marinomonas sp. 2405UD68-3 TaxID=3391835 RepID=UPI0039C962E6
MSLIGNIIWFLLGGFLMGLLWLFFGLLAAITIVGLPWARSCFMIAKLTFFPFGKQVISRKLLNQKDDIGTGGLGLIGNIIWIIFAGLWLAIGHVISAVLCCITIIGIPFGIQHIKLAAASLVPVGQTVVTNELATAVKRDQAESQLSSLRSK